MSDHRAIQTSRLTLRPLCEDDIPSLFAIQSTSGAMRFTYTAPSLDECARRLHAYEDSRTHLGFAPWVVVDRNASLVIGWGGLNVDPFDPGWGVEVSYFFHPTIWGRGYATELVLASLRHAFEDLSVPLVGAFAMPENVGSLRVLEKCGFEFLRYEPRLERNHYQAKRASRSSQPNSRFEGVLKATRASS
jgi:[ribosomal protein S5]-alanine N-acetyltransferase